MTLNRSATAAPLQQGSLAAWTVVAGSVIGAEHRRSGRANQDSWAVHRGRGCVVGVVADGCGSGAHSEVGAWIGARLWVRAVAEGLEHDGLCVDDDALWRGACERSLRALAMLLGELSGPPAERLAEALLFTLVGFVLTPTRLVTYALGDGLIWVDGRLTRLGPFPGNRPPYLAYGLVGDARSEVRIIERLDAAEVSCVIVGTDGAVDLIEREDRSMPGGEGVVGPLAQFGAPRYLTRPDALRRRLSLINREHLSIDWSRELVERSHGLLPDDTTLLVLGRRPQEAR